MIDSTATRAAEGEQEEGTRHESKRERQRERVRGSDGERKDTKKTFYLRFSAGRRQGLSRASRISNFKRLDARKQHALTLLCLQPRSRNRHHFTARIGRLSMLHAG